MRFSRGGVPVPVPDRKVCPVPGYSPGHKPSPGALSFTCTCLLPRCFQIFPHVFTMEEALSYNIQSINLISAFPAFQHRHLAKSGRMLVFWESFRVTFQYQVLSLYAYETALLFSIPINACPLAGILHSD